MNDIEKKLFEFFLLKILFSYEVEEKLLEYKVLVLVVNFFYEKIVVFEEKVL